MFNFSLRVSYKCVKIKSPYQLNKNKFNLALQNTEKISRLKLQSLNSNLLGFKDILYNFI